MATLVYELDASTSTQARKLLAAELAGRRYQDRFDGKRMPANCVWIRRSKEPEATVDDLAEQIKQELYSAVAAVARAGLPIRLVRGWVQVTGAGTFGIVDEPSGSTGENV